MHIVPEIGNIPLNKLTQNDLQQFYTRLKKNGRKTLTERYGEGLSDRMVRMCHATCRTALEKAVQDGLIRTNPAIGCKLPPKRAREMQVLDRDELQRFFIQAQAEGYYELFLLDLATGLRWGELMALQWDDLDFESGVLNVNKQVYQVNGELQFSELKTKNSIRKIVLPPSVVEVLKEYKKTVDSRWMFPSPVKEDCPLTPGVVRRIYRMAPDGYGLDKTGADSQRKKLLAQIENKLCTIARQGRAFGIHLILATQRPDATIIPGQIRNNMDFRVCGRADNVLSQIILDNTSAAEQIPKDAWGRFITADGTVFQGYLFDEGQL